MTTAIDLDAVNAAAAGWTCRHCDTTGAIRVELRPTLVSKPLGSFALAGAGMKTSAAETAWPWAVCRTDLGGCGHESRGTLDTDDQP